MAPTRIPVVNHSAKDTTDIEKLVDFELLQSYIDLE
jgi:hypothetical protein